MLGAESLRRLAARLSSLATLEGRRGARCPGSCGGASWTCGPDPCHGALASPALPLPKAAPSHPRGSTSLNQRGPTGLSVKSSSCSPALSLDFLLPPLLLLGLCFRPLSSLA